MAARPRQLSFLPSPRREHGGEIRRGRRKEARPFDPKRPLHLVLRSSRARGKWSFLHPKNKGHVHEAIERLSERHGVKIYRWANAGNHLHFLVHARSRRSFQAFLRHLAGSLAMLVTGARKAHDLGGERFWDHLAYTRIVEWGRDLARVQGYLIRNLLEGLGALTRAGEDAKIRFSGGEALGARPLRI